MTSWAAKLTFQASLVGIELFSYENSFFSSKKFAWTLGQERKYFAPKKETEILLPCLFPFAVPT